jgi:hypothetical protein
VSDIGQLPAYPIPKPTPRPAPVPQPPAAAPPPVPKPPQQSPLQQAQQNVTSADSALQTGYQKAADATKAQGAQEAALAGAQDKEIGGLRDREQQELSQLDQGQFKPTQDSLASLGSLFMLVGMAGAFLGGKGTTGAAANAQAALTGIIQGYSKGDDAEIARQKQIYDTNSAYLKDRAEKIRTIYKELYEDAKNGNLPGAISAAHQKLIVAGADVNAQVLATKGLDAAAKNAEQTLKTLETADEKKRQLDEMEFSRNQAHLDRLAALGAKGQFNPQAGAIMAALAAKGISLPTGLRSIQQQAALYNGLLARYPDKTPDEIADLIKGGQIDLKAELKETQTAAGIAGRVGVANAEIAPMADLVVAAASKVPRTSFLPINKLLKMSETQLQDPNLRDLQVKVNSLLNAYDVLAARGGTDMAKRETNHRLVTDADSPEMLAAGIGALKQEGAIAQQAADRAIHQYGGGQPAPGAADRPKPTASDREWVKKHPESREKFVSHFGVEP